VGITEQVEGFDPLVHVFNPYFVIYVDLGGSGPRSSFSLIPILYWRQTTGRPRFSLIKWRFGASRGLSVTAGPIAQYDISEVKAV